MTRIRVLNIGTAPTMHSTEISVFLSNSSQVNPGAAPVYVGQVPPLRPGGEVSFTFWIHSPGKFCIVMVDPRNAVAESDKGNNVQYEQLFWLR